VTVTAGGQHDGKSYLAVEDTESGSPPRNGNAYDSAFIAYPTHRVTAADWIAIVDEIARIHDAALDIETGPKRRRD